MKYLLTALLVASLPIGVSANDHHGSMDHSMEGHDHASMNHDDHDHAAMNHDDHDHSAMEHSGHDMSPKHALLTRTSDIDKALMAGGQPVVVDVLGVVCDFCATAMNKIFGKRQEVAAVYVDLDKKTLSLALQAGKTLSDQDIEKLAEQAGYRIAAIRRDSEAIGG
ncbi:MAG: heavy metal transport/detoxification protein [Halieaceae bacterium MED-G27]|jgi:hypothetical protein|nr:heavy metal transport/detoxification protein [Halieaceae bacterium]MAV74672.1 heavy metal transport/detoxification protein [Halieaceae bacterium]OUT67117.1 MAG: hypothetical protein CBB81_01745 [Cellvibrionales bacterium TMED21]PDH34812.1 MAG: heavy metal transport/detoxification protein [Halieaceae bacterium MED-G27]